LGVKIDKGHAVYIEPGSKRRETTIGATDILDSTLNNAPGGWVD
jgi:hypothetical protein